MRINFLLIINIFYLTITQAQDSNSIFEQNKNVRFCGAGLQNYEIKISSTISKSHQINPNRKLSSVYYPIRIILDTTYFEQQGSQITSMKDKISMLKESMNKAVKALTDILEVGKLAMIFLQI